MSATPAFTAAAWARQITPEMIDAAWTVWNDEGERPYGARVRDYVGEGMAAVDRAAGLEALRAADLDAAARNDDLMRRTIAAALSAFRGITEG